MLKAKYKIFTKESIIPVIASWKKYGRIVFTNGCFDILHLGHVDYLEKARSLGDKLIVGMNTDGSVQRLKGSHRPIVTEDSRTIVMASLQFVDGVILFDESTPLELIKFLMPDVLVKGDDYTIDTIVGAKEVIENGGEVKTISLVKGFSTTLIEKKIIESSKV